MSQKIGAGQAAVAACRLPQAESLTKIVMGAGDLGNNSIPFEQVKKASSRGAC